VLLHLVQEFNSVAKTLAFATAKDFEQKLLETRVITPRNLTGINFREMIQ
jgi:hypothetical protein